MNILYYQHFIVICLFTKYCLLLKTKIALIFELAKGHLEFVGTRCYFCPLY